MRARAKGAPDRMEPGRQGTQQSWRKRNLSGSQKETKEALELDPAALMGRGDEQKVRNKVS